MNTMKISQAHPDVQAAFEHVREVFDVTSVVYDIEFRWKYMLADGEAPAFPRGLLDLSILEAGSDALTEVPICYEI